jgi:hydroxymethylglutaryl-CoA reductase
MDSPFSGFYRKSLQERQAVISGHAGLGKEDLALLKKEGSLPLTVADRMSENVIGTVSLPLSIAVNFTINGRQHVIPMSVEEPSVVAAASNAAKLSSGFEASADESLMTGQVQLVSLTDAGAALAALDGQKDALLKKANSRDSELIRLGGGVKDINFRVISTERGDMLIAELLVDTRDAMGANAVNTFCESLKGELEAVSGGKARARIVSNLCTSRLARAKAVWKKESVGEDVIEAVLDAYAFAKADQFRATTHNKGIMNGVDAVAIATGQDFRALESAAHSYASFGRRYSPLTEFHLTGSGDLAGSIELPIAAGTVGGAVKTNPVAALSLKIAGVSSAGELAMLMACAGLANNFAALRALSTEGIQKGHMELHAKNIAVNAGAEGAAIEKVAGIMVKEGKVSVSRAKEILGGSE